MAVAETLSPSKDKDKGLVGRGSAHRRIDTLRTLGVSSWGQGGESRGTKQVGNSAPRYHSTPQQMELCIHKQAGTCLQQDSAQQPSREKTQLALSQWMHETTWAQGFQQLSKARSQKPSGSPAWVQEPQSSAPPGFWSPPSLQASPEKQSLSLESRGRSFLKGLWPQSWLVPCASAVPLHRFLQNLPKGWWNTGDFPRARSPHHLGNSSPVFG